MTGACYGAEVEEGMRPGEKPRKGLGATIVLRMAAECHLPPGTVVYADRYFSSPMLAVQMLRRGLHYVGTVTPNRKGFPKGVALSAKGERGESKTGYCKKTKIRALCWRDNKPVYMIATTGNLTATQDVKRRGVVEKGKKKTSIITKMPSIFADYNRGMGGVDLFDFLRNKYSTEKIFRCNFWYKKLALGLLGMLQTNAYIYWRAHTPQVTRDVHRTFYKELCTSLLHVGNVPDGAVADLPTGVDEKAAHCLRKIEGRPRCAWCSYEGRHRVQTRTACPTCQVGLCNPSTRDCSYLFHSSGLTPQQLREARPAKPSPAKRKRCRPSSGESDDGSATESNDDDLADE